MMENVLRMVNRHEERDESEDQERRVEESQRAADAPVASFTTVWAVTTSTPRGVPRDVVLHGRLVRTGCATTSMSLN